MLVSRFLLLTAVLCLAFTADAVAATTGFSQMLQAAQGQKVEIATNGGHIYRGVVKKLDGYIVHIGELEEREFFEAAIRIDAIEALVFKTEKADSLIKNK